MEALSIMSIEMVYLFAATFLVFSVFKYFETKRDLERKRLERMNKDFEKNVDKLIDEHNKALEIQSKYGKITEEKVKEQKEEYVLKGYVLCPKCGALTKDGYCEYCGIRLQE